MRLLDAYNVTISTVDENGAWVPQCTCADTDYIASNRDTLNPGERNGILTLRPGEFIVVDGVKVERPHYRHTGSH